MTTNTIPLTPVTSSQIHAIGHDPETNTLAIQFKAKAGEGSIYHYSNFTEQHFEEFKAAESIGSHFKRVIKPADDVFPFVRVS